MSDKKQPEKVKREYRKSGKALERDLRIRLDADTVKRLTDEAKRQQISRAALAREILQSAMHPDE